MSKKPDPTEKRKYIFHNLEAPQAIQPFSYATLDHVWERVLVPGATVELTDWEYNFIIKHCSKPVPTPAQDIDSPYYDPSQSVGFAPRFQLQPIL